MVIASGGYQVPIIPRFAERLPEGILQIHSQDYKNADQLPPGGVLVVGSGQSGAQLAETCTSPAAACTCASATPPAWPASIVVPTS